ncbi:hypothetical protein PHMEG_0003315 [Phytophthora megakarya]|uniref:Uncharacterized protein n=1 Tax=Phytophthora megakarya TaxID=4795 RepID=A0A225WYE2_9STRA|nr:hypothetical protein PHMEG_0003315 [Phytophthora megakarya]
MGRGERVKKSVCVFTRLLQSTVTTFVGIDETFASISPPSRGSATARIDPALLYAKLEKDYCGYVVSLDSSTKTKKSGYGSCAWIVWRLP